MTVLIDLLYVAGCRNLALARQRLEEAVAQSVADVAIREREISDPQDAETFSMRGSTLRPRLPQGPPTVLVDGRGLESTAVPRFAQLVAALVS
ncbi:MAG: hypothetical protein M3P85_13410 [Actinomycetota bacterium]|nr:hypothetical protein [Actinomycetota bacterium]